jgi:hypothetical protein
MFGFVYVPEWQSEFAGILQAQTRSLVELIELCLRLFLKPRNWKKTYGSRLLLPEATMESISQLHAAVLSAFGSRGMPQGEQKLFDELMAHKTCLLNIFDVGPRNAHEQREIESG